MLTNSQATGHVGEYVLPALAQAFPVTILTRTGSSRASSPAVAAYKVVTADFDSVDSLRDAIRGTGADVVVSLVGQAGIEMQPKLIDAAVQAGVRRFLPSEFGGDTMKDTVKELPVFSSKVPTMDMLQKLATEGKIEWTAITTGPLFDFCKLANDFI